MKNLEMFCTSMEPNHYEFIQKAGYIPSALGDKDLGFGIGATTGGPVSNRTGRGRTGYSEGGLASMFVEKR